jgi:hypothetical protein
LIQGGEIAFVVVVVVVVETPLPPVVSFFFLSCIEDDVATSPMRRQHPLFNSLTFIYMYMRMCTHKKRVVEVMKQTYIYVRSRSSVKEKDI